MVLVGTAVWAREKLGLQSTTKNWQWRQCPNWLWQTVPNRCGSCREWPWTAFKTSVVNNCGSIAHSLRYLRIQEGVFDCGGFNGVAAIFITWSEVTILVTLPGTGIKATMNTFQLCLRITLLHSVRRHYYHGNSVCMSCHEIVSDQDDARYLYGSWAVVNITCSHLDICNVWSHSYPPNASQLSLRCYYICRQQLHLYTA